MKKRILLFVAMMFCAVSVFAQTEYTDGQGVKYRLTDGASPTATVSGHTDDLANVIDIPATITSNEVMYSVTSIGERAFSNTALTSVTIPNSVTSIGVNAFFNCTSLTSVTIPNSVTSIGNAAFFNCTSLASVTIPNSVTSIGERAFQSCSSLTTVTIPNSVTSIGADAFYLSKSITDVYCYADPDNLTWNESGCDDFADRRATNCHVPSEYLGKWNTNLKKTVNVYFDDVFLLDDDNTDYQGIEYTLNDEFHTAEVSRLTDDLKSEIIIPATITSNEKAYSVTSIGESAFEWCESLASVTIPNSVTSIGEGAFYYCESLTSVTIERGDLGNLVLGSSVFYRVASGCNIELKYTGTLHDGFSVAYDITDGTGISIDGNKMVLASSTSEATLTTKEVSGAVAITKSDDGKYVATIDGNSSSSISLAEDIAVSSVTYNRSFKADGGAYTIMLPFDFTVTSDVKGSFNTLSSLEPTENNSKVWKAIMSDAITDIKAHTPYIFVPSENFSEMKFSDAEGITLKATTGAPLTNPCENTNWKLHGVYAQKTWTDADVNDYGFAAAAKGDVSVGEFVHFVTGASLKATRCYLEYSEKGFSKSATVLPEKIIVVFPDKTASVIEPGDPEDNGEITTPVSEIAPNNGAKVWAADKTIVIESKAGDQYRIIDLNGRTLRESRLAADREEVTLSRAAGIVVVIINGKTFKINY